MPTDPISVASFALSLIKTAGEELQYEMNALVLQLNHRYGAACVLEVLRASNPMMTRILN